jgi:hypothetical protein
MYPVELSCSFDGEKDVSSGRETYEILFFQEVDSVINVKPFSLVFASITDSDNQGEVPNGSIIDRDNQQVSS